MIKQKKITDKQEFSEDYEGKEYKKGCEWGDTNIFLTDTTPPADVP